MSNRRLTTLLQKSPADIVILSAKRTPICRAYKGQLKDAYPEELLHAAVSGALAAVPALPPQRISEVTVGVVLSELGGSKVARMAVNAVPGIDPTKTAVHTVNRACASSLQAVSSCAATLRSSGIEGMSGGFMVDSNSAMVAAGMESMTRNYGTRAIPTVVWPALVDIGADDSGALKASSISDSNNDQWKDVRDCLLPMGETSERVAARYNVSRSSQDAFALESHRRAARAQAENRFDSEIVPVRTRFIPPPVEATGSAAPGSDAAPEPTIIEVRADDGVRANATLARLQKLQPAFSPSGASTAGNSSQVSDGAAAVILMRREAAEAIGASNHIMGRFVGSTVVGCRPDEMGIGPARAVPPLLAGLGLEVGDVSRWELNEAFASQAIHCLRELGLENAWEQEKVNPDGGAIALGHPLGATGARLVTTLMHGLRRQDGEVGVVSLCIGTGMGMASLFIRE